MITLNRADFLDKLESVLPGISTREIIEQSSCFVFKDKTVMTFNDEISCSQKSCLPFEGSVQALPLISILRKLQEEELDISLGDSKEELIIKGKNKRDWVSEEEARAGIRDFGIDPYEPKKMLTPAKVEKLLGKDKVKIQSLIKSEHGKPVIAVETDKRETVETLTEIFGEE